MAIGASTPAFDWSSGRRKSSRATARKASCRKAWAIKSTLCLLGPSPADSSLDEVVDLAIQHGLGVPGLVLGAQVLDHLVRVEHVVAHLVTPRRLYVSAQLVQVGPFFGLLEGQQLGLEDDHGAGLVLQLA